MARTISQLEAETLFLLASRALLEDISDLALSLQAKETRLKKKTIGSIRENEEKGSYYEKNILRYINGLRIIRIRHGKIVTALALKVTHTVNTAHRTLTPRKYKIYRKKVWLEFAAALECLGGRPSKKVAALLISDDNRLLSWDVNHLCHGITEKAYLFVKDKGGDRGYHLWCAERNVLAKYLGMAAIMPDTDDKPTIHKAIDRLTLSLKSAAVADAKLRAYTLVTSHYPCGICADVLAPSNMDKKGRSATVGEIIAAWNPETEGQLQNPNRKTRESRGKFRQAGIRVHRQTVSALHA